MEAKDIALPFVVQDTIPHDSPTADTTDLRVIFTVPSGSCAGAEETFDTNKRLPMISKPINVRTIFTSWSKGHSSSLCTAPRPDPTIEPVVTEESAHAQRG
jgi:hypothetical protein